MYALLLQKVVLLLDLGPEDIRTFPLGFVVILGRQLSKSDFTMPQLDFLGQKSMTMASTRAIQGE
jgi:hypothetical protein